MPDNPALPLPDKVTIALAVQKIVAAYNHGLDPAKVQAAWHIHFPWPPIGMDDPTLAQMVPPLNDLIQQYKPANGVTQKDVSDADMVVDLMNVVWGKVK